MYDSIQIILSIRGIVIGQDTPHQLCFCRTLYNTSSYPPELFVIFSRYQEKSQKFHFYIFIQLLLLHIYLLISLYYHYCCFDYWALLIAYCTCTKIVFEFNCSRASAWVCACIVFHYINYYKS